MDLFKNSANIDKSNTNSLFNNNINNTDSFFSNNNVGNNINIQETGLIANTNSDSMSNSLYKKDNLLSDNLEDLCYIFNEKSKEIMRQKINDFDKMDIKD